jgi:hypothetical protein
MRPAPDLLGRRKHDADGIEVSDWAGKLERVRTEQGDPPWQAFSTLPRLIPGFLEDPSFPGSDGYRFQEGPLKTVISDQLSVISSRLNH